MTITTPSGYKVEIKDRLTYGDKRAIKSIVLQSMRMEQKGKGDRSVTMDDLTFAQKMEDEVFKRAIVSITKDDKLVTGDLLKEVMSWDEEDGEMVMEHLNDKFDPAGVQKKTT